MITKEVQRQGILMTKQEAIQWYKEITNGSGVDRYEILDVLDRAKLAVKYWDNEVFTLGIEYGILIALIKAFSLTREDLRK